MSADQKPTPTVDATKVSSQVQDYGLNSPDLIRMKQLQLEIVRTLIDNEESDLAVINLGNFLKDKKVPEELITTATREAFAQYTRVEHNKLRPF